MDSQTVILQGNRFPICLAGKNSSSITGFKAVAIKTPQCAKTQIEALGSELAGNLAKRLEVIKLIQTTGQSCSPTANARDTAKALTIALTNGNILCFHKQQKKQIQYGTNTNSPNASGSGQSASNNKKKQSSNSTPTKKATQAEASQTGSATNSTPSEVPVEQQECRSDPVSMLTGEEILPLIDFELESSFKLIWRRLYRSSKSDKKSVLGHGWYHDFLVNLTEHYAPPPKVGPKQKGRYWLEFQDKNGATHQFEKVKPGQTSYQTSSQLSLHYQTNGKQVLIAPDDHHLTFKAGEKGWLLEKIINEKGHTQHFYYDNKDRLIKIALNAVRGCNLVYNKNGMLAKIVAFYKDENNHEQQVDGLLAHYQYDDNQSLIAATNQFSETEHYQYNAANLLIKRTRASGFSHHFEWDGYSAKAKCIKQWGDNNTYCYTFEYDIREGMTKSTDSRGNTETFYHNAQGKLVKHLDANGNPWLKSYNAMGLLARETNPEGGQKQYHYTQYGQLKSIIDENNQQTEFAYNQLGQRILTRFADGTEHLRKYSASGLLLNETHRDGRTSHYSYDNNSRLIDKIAPDGTTTKLRWNEQGELLAKQVNDSLTRFSYDALGRVNATINENNLITQYLYNNIGKISEVITFDENAPDQKNIIKYEYDEAGRLIATVDANGAKQQRHFEGLSQPESITQADGSTLNLKYDAERNLTKIIRDDGATYTIDYDANENPTRIQGFDGKKQALTYDKNNHLIAIYDANKRSIKITRDKLGRVVLQQASLEHANGITNNTNHFRYNTNGLITQAHNQHITVKQTFDQGDRLVTTKQGQHQLAYHYNEQGKRKQLKLADGKTLNYRYHQQGHLASISINDGKEEQVLVTLKYNRQGQITHKDFANGIGTKQSYDAFARLISQQTEHAKNTVYQNSHYRYDNNHQITQIESTGQKECKKQFTYNQLGQLVKDISTRDKTSTEITQYTWDAYGNPKANTDEAVRPDLKEHAGQKSKAQATLIEGDKLLSHSGIDYQYDELGNQISALGEGVKSAHSFNAFNQLASFLQNGQLTSYEYDPIGRRVKKHTQHGTIEFIWDGDQLLGEYQSGQYTWYINLPEQYHPIAMIKGEEQNFYHLDHLNTPQFLTNQQGEVTWHNQSDAYGFDETPQTIHQPIRFQGQYFDAESGLHYNRHRYYSPKQQRFINQDPISIVGGINHYQYAPNPINWVDPLGLLCKEGQAKVAQAINNNVAISQELKDKLISISLLKHSCCTAEEMVKFIDNADERTVITDIPITQPDISPKYGGRETYDGGIDATTENVYKDPKTVHLDADETRKPTFKDDVMLALNGTNGKAKSIPKSHEKDIVVERIYNGKTYRIKKDKNAMPVFTIFETYLDDTHINSSDDDAHFAAANKRLGELLVQNPNLKDELGLTDKQYKHLTKDPASKRAPPGLTWHHHQDTGKIQLVDKELHKRFGHIGGMERWGGGR